MRPYIRFETELPLARNRAQLGVFRAAGMLEDKNKLPDYTQELLRSEIDRNT